MAFCIAVSINAVHKSVFDSSIQLVRPSDFDFVEVIRGGELATDLVIQLKHIKVPEEGYMILNVGDQSIIMCPRSADHVSECPNGDENLPTSVILSFFGVELGPQRICVDIFGWDHAPVAHECSVLVGSDRFMGLQESREYFAANMNEFNHGTAMKRFWSTLVLKYSEKQICSVSLRNHRTCLQLAPPIFIFLRCLPRHRHVTMSM